MAKIPKVRKLPEVGASVAAPKTVTVVPSLHRSDAMCEPNAAAAKSPAPIESLTDEQRRAHFWSVALKTLKLPFARKGSEQYNAAIELYKKYASDYERAHHPKKTHDDLVQMDVDERKQYLWQTACIECGARPRAGTPEYDEVMALYIKLIHAFEATQEPVDAADADTVESSQASAV